MSQTPQHWRTPREEHPRGRFEFYDQRTGAKGIGIISNGAVSSITLKEGPSGWAYHSVDSITHWRPDGLQFGQRIS